MECCNKCFKDSRLQILISDIGTKKDWCDRCGSKAVSVIDPSKLYLNFNKVSEAYQRSSKGRGLFDLMNEEWQIFDLPDQQAKTLLHDILGNDTDDKVLYRPSQVNYPESKELWEGFRQELIEENRFFFRTDFPIVHSRLRDYIADLQLPAIDCQKDWYRARIQESEKWEKSKMGMPPKGRAGPGRANPVGISYLYLGSSNTSVVNEVRPRIGNKVTVATFTLSIGVKIVDLRTPRDNLSPFQMESSDDVSELREFIALIEELNTELSKPVREGKAPIDYIPSQYLCEFVKSLGYEGIVYDSSVGEGTNLALFAENHASIVGEQTVSYHITGYEYK